MPGQFFVLDAAARRSLAPGRNSLVRPVGEMPSEAGDSPGCPPLCPECGRASARQAGEGFFRAADPPPFDDLDVLVDRLEQRCNGDLDWR